MRFLLAAILLIASCITAAAQGCGSTNPNCIVPTAPAGTSDNRAASTAFVQSSASGSAVKGPATSVVGDVPQWNNTLGTLLSDPANISSNAQDFYFGTGRPSCDVRAKGAVGDNVTDDTVAFQACVTQLTVGGANHLGGTLYVPPAKNGIYCLFSGLSITAALPIEIIGPANGSPSLSTCGNDVNLLSLNNARHSVRNLTLLGPNIVGTTHDALVLNSSCTECTVDNTVIDYGRYGINNSAADVKMTTINVSLSLGAAQVYSTGSFSCSACKLDSIYPGTTPSAGTNRAAWQSSHSYSANTVVTSSGYVWQAMNAGTSGGSAPTTQPYGTYIQDNVTGTCPSPSAGVCWLLVDQTPSASVQCDTGCSTVTITNRSDLSGAFDYGLYISGSGQSVMLSNSYVAAYLYGVYDNSSVGGLIAASNECNGMIASTSVCFYVRSSDDIVSNNVIIGPFIGIETDGGKNYTFANNHVWGATAAAIYIAGAASNVSVIGNVVGSSSTWGTNAIGIDIPVAAPDYITVIGNQCHGATTCVSNSSTGTHNLIETTPGIITTPITFADNGIWNATGITTTAINGSTVGATTPSTGAFTTLSATSTVNGAGITALFASPPAIGGTAPAAGAFTTLSATSTVNGAGITALFASPPAIGGTAAAAGKFTSLNASGQITSTTGLPTIASGACGATTNGAVVSGSTNQSGQITIGSAATTTCTISWSGTLAVAPNACVFFPMNAAAAATGTTVARVGAPSTGSVVLTGSALANANYAYLCL